VTSGGTRGAGCGSVRAQEPRAPPGPCALVAFSGRRTLVSTASGPGRPHLSPARCLAAPGAARRRASGRGLSPRTHSPLRRSGVPSHLRPEARVDVASTGGRDLPARTSDVSRSGSRSASGVPLQAGYPANVDISPRAEWWSGGGRSGRGRPPASHRGRPTLCAAQRWDLRPYFRGVSGAMFDMGASPVPCGSRIRPKV